MEDRPFENDVGEIKLQSDESFWIFPSCYIDRYGVNVCSPWFSYLGDMWRFVMSPRYKSYYKVNFYLWRKFHCDLPGSMYILQLKLKTLEGEQFVIREEVSNGDYGFQISEVFCKDDLPKIARCAQIKIFFVIKDASPSSNDSQCASNEGNSTVNVRRAESSNEDEMSCDEDCNEEISENNGFKILSDNLKSVFLDEQLSDVVLKVGADGYVFNVHKVILTARSPVFASTFQHDFSEKKDNKVDIPDCNAESFKIFLLYIYSGSTETLSVSTVCNVYYAADKYQINDLKEKCVKYMKSNLSAKTICDFLALSLHHGEVKLRKACFGFFCANIREILPTVQWQKFIAANPTEANELLILAHN